MRPVLEIRYRYVGFGTVFVPRQGSRAPDQGRLEPRFLYANELALDVGGICWGYGNETLSVLDHHFNRPGQFPSASAAVLHNRKRIRERFQNLGDTGSSVLWLVTHQQPDFDAFCAMYLARIALEEYQLAPSGEIPGSASAYNGARSPAP